MRLVVVTAAAFVFLAACGGSGDAEPASPQALAEEWLSVASVEGGGEASLSLIAPDVREAMDTDAYVDCIGAAVTELQELNIRILERRYDGTAEEDGATYVNLTYVLQRANTVLDIADTLEVVETGDGWRVVGSVANEGCISQSSP
ncbi:MAG: hypothetical protein ACR2PK_15965 [Acidimicrobiales bacterium]